MYRFGIISQRSYPTTLSLQLGQVKHLKLSIAHRYDIVTDTVLSKVKIMVFGETYGYEDDRVALLGYLSPFINLNLILFKRETIDLGKL